MCGRDKLNPLAARLFRDEGLCLVKVARSPAELHPGIIIVTFPQLRDREPTLHPLARILVDPPVVMPASVDYKRLSLPESSGSLGVEATADLSGVLGDVEGGEFKTALTAAGSRRFELTLGDARRADLDVGGFEMALRNTTFSEAAREMTGRGCRIYVVTRTVIANEVLVTGDREMDATAMAQLSAVGGGELKIRSNGRQVLRMGKAASEMVIGFKGLEIIDPGDGLILNGMQKPLDLRGEERAELAVPAGIDEFTDDPDTIFVALK